MIHSILRHLGGIEQYGILSLCLFGAVFIGVLAWALGSGRATWTGWLRRRSSLN